MQETRRYILEILRERREATVSDIVADLCEVRHGDITAVTVRHHLNILQEEGLIHSPEIRHRSTPGRPRHIYQLTEKAEAFFPSNYGHLAAGLLEQMEKHLPKDSINVILEGVAIDMAHEAGVVGTTMKDRLEGVVNYLNDHGYDAAWETHRDGFMLHTRNCPYHQLARNDEKLCQMDMRMVSAMLGVVPRLMSRISGGDETCSYLIPYTDA